MKICRRCKKEKEDLEFSVDTKSKDGLCSNCKDCSSESARERALWYQYGITIGQYELMLKSQNGKCAICSESEVIKQNGKLRRLSVDHNHATGKIRALLCDTCNRHLGILENEDWTPKAQAYLEKHKCN